MSYYTNGVRNFLGVCAGSPVKPQYASVHRLSDTLHESYRIVNLGGSGVLRPSCTARICLRAFTLTPMDVSNERHCKH